MIQIPTDQAPFRPGVVVDPVCRLDQERVQGIHRASMALLDDPGVLCDNERVVDIFRKAGCPCSRAGDDGGWWVNIPEGVAMAAVTSAPDRVILGARDPGKRLCLDAGAPRVYFGTGAETNVTLEARLTEFAAIDGSGDLLLHPIFSEERGSVARLCDSARLCNALEQVDFFIRNVNIQDAGIAAEAKDVNVFFASLLYMTKHVQAGLADLAGLEPVLRMAEMIAGGPEALAGNPLVSFIACVVKSPLQIVADTAEKVLAIAGRRVPLVISSSPQGGSTAPIQEEGMVAQINAEILAGITLAQLAAPGTPVLYGAVPVRARLDDLHDLYGAPEFIHYNIDCIQMARHYNLPCYSTAGVGDAGRPGLQAAAEKMFSHLAIAQAGAQYIHYAFGLLGRTGIWCPAQAVIDDANLALVKQIVRRPRFGARDLNGAIAEIRKVMSSGSRLFARQIRKHRRRGLVSPPYALESPDNGSVLANACAEVERIRAAPDERLAAALAAHIQQEIPGLLPLDAFTP